MGKQEKSTDLSMITDRSIGLERNSRQKLSMSFERYVATTENMPFICEEFI